jgi:Protein of unknown function (DUF3302)
MDFLSYFALAIIIFVFLTLAYGIVAIHDIPYNIAKARNRPIAIHSGKNTQTWLLVRMPEPAISGEPQKLPEAPPSPPPLKAVKG